MGRRGPHRTHSRWNYRQALWRSRSHERGFTLVELLVVIVILGILSAVVVFAMRGAGETGRVAAIAADERIIRTAEEAYCAQNGRYAEIGNSEMPGTLVGDRFLSEAPEYHTVSVTETGGPCNGTAYTVEQTSPPPASTSTSSTSSSSTSTSSTTSTTRPVTCGPVSAATWTPVASPGGDLYGLTFVDLSNGWAVGGAGVIWRTPDGGQSWTAQKSVGFILTTVTFIDPNRGWAGGQGGIVRTVDGGATWSEAVAPGNDFYAISMSDATNGFAAATRGVFRTTDGGQSWANVRPASSPQRYVAAAATDQNTAHAAEGFSGGIWGTRDGGVTWLLEKPGEPDPTSQGRPGPFAMTFPNSSTGYAAGYNGMIFTTSTGGLTWSSQPSCTTRTLRGVSFLDASNGVAVGEGGTVVRTRNGGATWGSDGDVGTLQNLYAVSYPSASTAFAVGDGGTVLRASLS